MDKHEIYAGCEDKAVKMKMLSPFHKQAQGIKNLASQMVVNEDVPVCFVWQYEGEADYSFLVKICWGLSPILGEVGENSAYSL